MIWTKNAKEKINNLNILRKCYIMRTVREDKLQVIFNAGIELDIAR